MRRALAALLLCWPILAPHPAHAWGDEGHEIIATIADALMTPAARRQVHAMLATDDDPLTEHDMAAEATWADHLRSANADGARSRTRQWHFVDIELHSPSLDAACFGHPKLPPAALASLGPAQACIVDKIDQFATELARADTPPDERLAALKFLLHFVGDVHQPLHAADDDDRGGNDKPVSADGMRAGNLHHYWDTECVRALGQGPVRLQQSLSSTSRRPRSPAIPVARLRAGRSNRTRSPSAMHTAGCRCRVAAADTASAQPTSMPLCATAARS